MVKGTPSRPRFRKRPTTRQRAACALFAAALLAPLPAAGQAVDHALMRAEILDVTTVQNEADMDFGDIIPGTADGRVIMTPNENGIASCTTTNGIVRTGTCDSARFNGTVPFIYVLQVTGPPGGQVNLVGPAGATMRLHSFRYAKGTGLMLGGSATSPNYFVIGGSFVLHVGGTLDVARTQRPGVYNGTFEVSFNYE